MYVLASENRAENKKAMASIFRGDNCKYKGRQKQVYTCLYKNNRNK